MNLKHTVLAIALGVLMIWPFTSPAAAPDTATAYDFTFHALTGSDPLPLASFKGKVVLVVNTASRCGFTGQYEALEKLYEAYKGKGLVIVGVPSDDFGHQEPGSNDEIAHFCKMNYGVSFPMAAKEHVVGDQAHPFYKWAKSSLGVLSAPKWNFHKYLIDRQGHLVEFFYSTTTPDSARLVSAVQKYLAAAGPSP